MQVHTVNSYGNPGGVGWGGVKAFRKNCQGGPPILGLYWILINKSFEIRLGGEGSYIYPPLPPSLPLFASMHGFPWSHVPFFYFLLFPIRCQIITYLDQWFSTWGTHIPEGMRVVQRGAVCKMSCFTYNFVTWGVCEHQKVKKLNDLRGDWIDRTNETCCH
jgi:hypothetical protein